MRGTIGRSGAGICPVRGHSNVQGQRTVGITEKPELFPLDRLGEQFGFEPPREAGYNKVEACEADDRFRGINNTRKVVLMDRPDIDRLGLKVGQAVMLETVADDGVDRRLAGLLVVAYDIPIGCIGGYYPECNVPMPIWHYAIGSKTPAAKMIPVRGHSDGGEVLAPQRESAAV